MDRLSNLGLGINLPDGWDGRIYRRANEGGAGERRALHAANFPLPPSRGDYGAGVYDAMARDGVFVSLVEFHPDNSNQGLFASQGIPRRITADDFSPDAMPRVVPGQGGAQFFFSVGDRAFSLFVVIGSYADRARLVPAVNAVVATVSVD